MYDSFGSYIKKSFKLIFENPILFVPTLFSLLITVASTLLPVASLEVSNISDTSHIGFIAMTFLILIVVSVIQTFISSGRLYMIKQLVTVQDTSMGDFWFGLKKYALRLLLGSLLIFGIILLSMLILILPAVFIGRTSSIFILLILLILFLIVGGVLLIFISFWMTILVYEDCGITDAFKMSFSFIKKHFGLVFMIHLLNVIFTGIGGSSKNSRNNTKPSHNKVRSFLNFENYLRTSTSLPVEIIAFISTILLIIRTFFLLYFNVVFFAVYHDRREDISNDEILED